MDIKKLEQRIEELPDMCIDGKAKVKEIFEEALGVVFKKEPKFDYQVGDKFRYIGNYPQNERSILSYNRETKKYGLVITESTGSVKPGFIWGDRWAERLELVINLTEWEKV